MRRSHLVLLFLLLTMNLYAQTYNRQESLNVTLTNDTILYPFDRSYVTSIAVSGQISFTSELGFVRIVVNDDYDDKYMIYESYSIFEDNPTFNFSEKCEESCFYESYIPTELIIQVKDAIIYLNGVNMGNTRYSNVELLRINAASTINTQKLLKVQNYIQNHGLIWVAAPTRLSSLSYQQKAKILGEDYKTYGYEYYSKGFFSIFGPDRYSSSKNFVGNFDWRNRHRANDSLSPYYDGDPLGTGWITPITCQGQGCYIDGDFDCYLDSVECHQLGGIYREAGTCWIFGPTAQVEALTNLYYNQHLDVDLSEQYIACKERKISASHPFLALKHFKLEGVPLESCLPYIASLDSCGCLCDDSLVRVGITDYSQHSCSSLTDLSLKQLLINSGPLTASSLPLGYGMNHHCMALVGWGTIDDDIIQEVLGAPVYANGSYDHDFLGLTYWIYKESIGTDVGDNGFKYILHIDGDVPGTTYSIPTPIQNDDLTVSDIRCNDYDGDGYYNWGIGPKPAHCPPCPDEPDGDDSNPNLGPLNNYGQCAIIGNYNASFEDGWDNWMQVESSLFDNGIFWRYNHPSTLNQTGPSQAHDGDYYIYVDSGDLTNYHHSVSCIESPDINIQGSCYNILDFYYHMKIYDWHSGEENPIIMLNTQKADGSWSASYPRWIETGDHGSEWQHASILLPSDVKKARLYVETGMYQYSNIAIDDITIGPWNHNNSSIVINDTIVWDNDMFINQDVIIENGGCLIIRKAGGAYMKIQLHPETKIIIKPGGKLILDHCKLKSACNGEMWQGIEVWGDSNADQQLHHGTYYQGYLEMKNGATIENAVCAVELWHPNYWGTTGGIIHATDAIFRNNAKAVHALNYVDHNLNGNEIAYNSQFTKCSFIIDEDYLGTETFFKHVDLANVNSVYFSGCDFSVEPKADGVSPSCMGIGAYGAGFLVKSYCEEPNMHPSCPENDMVKCTFEGFNNGILSINENSQARSFTVRDASFIKNNRGVFIQNTGYATIVRSDFQIGGNSSCGYGIYADGVTGFRIEENSFSPSQGVQCPTYGIGIFNSQGVNDVYLNTFDGLTCANVAYGVNHIADVSGRPPATIPGLTYSCNDNTGNGIDFCVLKDNGSGGIASPQGSATVPAGNTFSGSNYHFYNGGDYEVKYFCKLTGANEIPDPTKMQYVDSDTITCSNDCASHYGNGGVVRSTEEKAALAAIYQSSSDAHERMTAAGDIIRSCLNEDAIDAAVLRQWLGNMHELASDRMAVASYIQEGDFTSALSLAGSLPSTYNLQDDDLLDHNDYMTLLSLYNILHNSNRTIYDLTSSETDMVKDMAENGLGASQQMARAILMTINDRYIEPYICPDMPRNPDRGSNTNNVNADTSANDSEFSVTVAPIPATTWVSVDYKLPCKIGTAKMSVFNSLGVKVMEVELDGQQGAKTLDLHGMPDGVYSYIVRCGEYQNTGKLIITL